MIKYVLVILLQMARDEKRLYTSVVNIREVSSFISYVIVHLINYVASDQYWAWECCLLHFLTNKHSYYE